VFGRHVTICSVLETETLVATVRDFAERSQAQRVVALVDQGDGATAAMLEWDDGAMELVVDGAPTPLPELEGAPLPLGDLRPPPATAVHVHAEAGELHAPIGAIGHLAEALLDLAAALGGRSVATAEWATADPELPMTLAARQGEPVIVALGDDQFELPL
jgi:hypothetical protein